MTIRSGVGAIGCVLILSAPGSFGADADVPVGDAGTAELQRQIGELRRRVEALEARLDSSAPAPGAAQPTAAPMPGGWREAHNWNLLKKGMDHHRLRALLGEPEDTRRIGKFTLWQYPNGQVKLYLRRVTSWSH